MALQEEIDRESSQIRTDSYPMSIGELLNLYRDSELDVHPEFQRVFRWSDTQKTRLIESILLGIPIPPVFVAQQKNGIWDVVDGVQRISTILQFVGELKDEKGKLVDPLILQKTKFLPSLENKTWHGENSFSRDQQLYIKRAKIDVNIVLKESDERAKFELFMRLNTGGSALSAQEVRNCLMIMAYPETYEWINKLSSDPHFKDALSLSDRLITEQYHTELVTRFLALRISNDQELSKVGDIGDFLNSKLEKLHKLDDSQRRVEEKAFSETFKYIYETFEGDAFRRYDAGKERFSGGFLISAFEIVALGVGYNIDSNDTVTHVSDFEGKVKKLWSNYDFTSNSGSGIRASSRIQKIVPLGRTLFSS